MSFEDIRGELRQGEAAMDKTPLAAAEAATGELSAKIARIEECVTEAIGLLAIVSDTTLPDCAAVYLQVESNADKAAGHFTEAASGSGREQAEQLRQSAAAFSNITHEDSRFVSSATPVLPMIAKSLAEAGRFIGIVQTATVHAVNRQQETAVRAQQVRADAEALEGTL